MTEPDEVEKVRADARRLVERSTREAGLPYHITDPVVLHRIARMMLRRLDDPTRPPPGGERVTESDDEITELFHDTTNDPPFTWHLQWPHGTEYAHLWARVPDGWDGISVPAAWANVILETDAALAEIDPDYEIYQVKEKYGGLRYYCSLGVDDRSPEAERIIDEAERRVEQIEGRQ